MKRSVKSIRNQYKALSQEQQLQHNILEEPEDQYHWQIYADWLEEMGREEAKSVQAVAMYLVNPASNALTKVADFLDLDGYVPRELWEYLDGNIPRMLFQNWLEQRPEVKELFGFITADEIEEALPTDGMMNSWDVEEDNGEFTCENEYDVADGEGNPLGGLAITVVIREDRLDRPRFDWDGEQQVKREMERERDRIQENLTEQAMEELRTQVKTYFEVRFLEKPVRRLATQEEAQALAQRLAQGPNGEAAVTVVGPLQTPTEEELEVKAIEMAEQKLEEGAVQHLDDIDFDDIKSDVESDITQALRNTFGGRR